MMCLGRCEGQQVTCQGVGVKHDHARATRLRECIAWYRPVGSFIYVATAGGSFALMGCLLMQAARLP